MVLPVPTSRSGQVARRTIRAAVWLTLALVPAALLAGFFLGQPIPLAVMLALGALAVVALWAPANALLLVASLCPLAGVLHGMSGAPYNPAALLEAAILIALAAASTRAALRAAPLTVTLFDVAILSLVAVAVASCVALLPMTLLRAGANDGAAALRRLIFHDYFVRPAEFNVIASTALLVEGAALSAVVARAIRTPRLAIQLSNMLVLGGAAAAAMNVYRLLEIALRRPPFWTSVLEVLSSMRFNTQYGDVNAAGSYFAMVTVVAAHHAGFRGTAGRLHAAALPLLGCALWVSGSRVALAAAFLTILALKTTQFAGRGLRLVGTRTQLAAVTVALVGGLALLVYLFPVTRHSSFLYSVSTRLQLLEVGGRMVAARPIWGVGISQYYALYPRYTSPELQQTFAEAVGRPVTHENAHNQFLQVLAELGIVGFTCFALVLALAFGRHGGRDPVRGGAAAALFAFLLTCLAGHPLLTPVVACAFWMLVGLTAAGEPAIGARTSRRIAIALAAAAVLLVMTMPWRWRLERRHADLTDVTVGLSGWQRDEEGRRFQSMNGEGSVFASSESPFVRLPLRSPDGFTRRVRIFLDGRPAGSAQVPPAGWVDVTLPLPPGRHVPAYRRIDLVVEGLEGGAAAGSLWLGRVAESDR